MCMTSVMIVVTDKKGNETDKGILKVFPSIAQQWKNQIKGKYVKPYTYSTVNPNKLDTDQYLTTLKSYTERT